MPATVTAKEKLALRTKAECAHTTSLLARLELLVPNVDENKGSPGYRSKACAVKAKEGLLSNGVHAVRLAHGPIPPDALQQAFTIQARGGLIAIESKRGKIAHQSPSIQDLTS